MKNFFRLIVLLLIAGGWTLAASSVYVVRTPETFVPLTKETFSFKDTYVDTTKWTLADVSSHPEVVNRLIERNKAASLAHLTDPKNGDIKTQLIDAMAKAPATAAAAPAAKETVDPFATPADKPVEKKEKSIFDFGR